MLFLKLCDTEIMSLIYLKDIYKIIGTKDYINCKLRGRILTDNSYASDSGVYDLKNRKYKQEFIEDRADYLLRYFQKLCLLIQS